MKTKTQLKHKSAALHDPFKLRGYLEYVLRDAKTGEIVQKGGKYNTVTFGGRGWALNKLISNADAQILSAIAIGSSSTAPTANDTRLPGYAQIRVFGNQGITTSTNAACTFQGSVSFSAGETFAGSDQIWEFGIYNSATSAGRLFNRLTTGTVINFATSNTLAISITITN
jgi:hypothetical protein